MFITAVIAEHWKPPKCPSMGEWLNIQTMGYESAIKRNRPLIDTVTCMNLREIMLNKKKPISESYILYGSTYITFIK